MHDVDICNLKEVTEIFSVTADDLPYEYDRMFDNHHEAKKYARKLHKRYKNLQIILGSELMRGGWALTDFKEISVLGGK